MESQNEKLGKFIDNFKKEDYIEKEAKTRLNLKKPGEKVVIIVQEEAKKTEEEVKGKFFDFEKIKEFWQKIKESWSRQKSAITKQAKVSLPTLDQLNSRWRSSDELLQPMNILADF